MNVSTVIFFRPDSPTAVGTFSFVSILYVKCSVKYFHSGRKFCARSSNHIIKMKKEKTFNQEVEHFSRVLEAEISKKEC